MEHTFLESTPKETFVTRNSGATNSLTTTDKDDLDLIKLLVHDILLEDETVQEMAQRVKNRQAMRQH